MTAMYYFDDLNQEALDAFGELNGGIPAPHAPSSCDINLIAMRNLCGHQQQDHRKKSNSRGIKYLFKLNNPITPAVLSAAAILSSQPNIIEGEGEDGIVKFCLIEERDVVNVKKWLAERHPNFLATFAPVNKAYKELSPFSMYPTLGIDNTMPQYRPQNSAGPIILPTQNQYPVWYFFYGSLANSTFLAELFGLTNSVPILHRATIYGGKLRTWGKKYKALIDSPGSRVYGWTYEVLSQEQEDVLLAYETAKYEVVRVTITFQERPREDRAVQGCTFRFAGKDDELDAL